jgi:hypothetical protein
LSRTRVIGFLVAACLLICAVIVARLALHMRRPVATFFSLTSVPIFASGAIGIVFDRLESALICGAIAAIAAEAYYFFWILAGS